MTKPKHSHKTHLLNYKNENQSKQSFIKNKSHLDTKFKQNHHKYDQRSKNHITTNLNKEDSEIILGKTLNKDHTNLLYKKTFQKSQIQNNHRFRTWKKKKEINFKNQNNTPYIKQQENPRFILTSSQI